MSEGVFLNDRVTQERIAWIDQAKGWTILFVVIYHALMSIHNTNFFPQEDEHVGKWGMFIIATFIMPVFFALSGLVYREVTCWNEYRKKMIKRIISLGIPYIVFSAIYVFMQSFSPGNVTGTVHSWHNLLLIFMQPISYLWYLYALVLIYLLSGCLDLCKMRVEGQFTISLFLFFIAALIELPVFLYMLFTWTATFNLGRLLKKYQGFYQTKYFMAAFFIMVISWRWQLTFAGEQWYDPNNLTMSNFFSKMASIPVCFFVLSKLRRNLLNEFFRKYGRDSLIIYLVHAPMVSVLRAIFVKIGVSNYFLMTIGVIFFAWLISMFVCYLAKNVTVVEFIFYPTRYIRLNH